MAKYRGMPRVDAEAIERQMLKAMDDIVDAGKRKLDGIDTTWNHKVRWVVEKARVVGEDARAGVTTEDSPFFYLDGGTGVRYATMTQDFNPKTEPNVFTSKVGRGGVAFISKRQARPGIQARRWTEILALTMGNSLSISINEVAAGTKRRPKVSGVRVRIYTPE